MIKAVEEIGMSKTRRVAQGEKMKVVGQPERLTLGALHFHFSLENEQN